MPITSAKRKDPSSGEIPLAKVIGLEGILNKRKNENGYFDDTELELAMDGWRLEGLAYESEKAKVVDRITKEYAERGQRLETYQFKETNVVGEEKVIALYVAGEKVVPDIKEPQYTVYSAKKVYETLDDQRKFAFLENLNEHMKRGHSLIENPNGGPGFNFRNYEENRELIEPLKYFSKEIHGFDLGFQDEIWLLMFDFNHNMPKQEIRLRDNQPSSRDYQ